MEVSFPLSACSSVGNLRGDGLRYETSAVTVELDQRGWYRVEIFGVEEKGSLQIKKEFSYCWKKYIHLQNFITHEPCREAVKIPHLLMTLCDSGFDNELIMSQHVCSSFASLQEEFCSAFIVFAGSSQQQMPFSVMQCVPKSFKKID